jgi:hypothetical protein
MSDTPRPPPARRPRHAGGFVLRILFGSVTSVSLLLCLATACLWARSYWRWDRYRVHSGGASDYHLVCGSGVAGLTITTDDLWSFHHYPFAWQRGGPQYATGPAPPNPFRPGRSFWNRLGFCDFTFVNAGNAFETSFRTINVPLWFPALVSAAPAAGWLVHFRRRPRFKAGQCRYCGYDLRATPDRCPECGEAAIFR